jgi:hypothetical protein
MGGLSYNVIEMGVAFGLRLGSTDELLEDTERRASCARMVIVAYSVIFQRR